MNSPHPIRIIVGKRTLTAVLDDSAAARDFASLLPLSLKLSDYASTEKISDLPRKLITTGAPEGIDPKIGDLAYYVPWSHLVIFNKEFGYSAGLVRLGRISSGVEALVVLGNVPVRIER